jgi:hypothetical protein
MPIAVFPAPDRCELCHDEPPAVVLVVGRVLLHVGIVCGRRLVDGTFLYGRADTWGARGAGRPHEPARAP